MGIPRIDLGAWDMKIQNWVLHPSAKDDDEYPLAQIILTPDHDQTVQKLGLLLGEENMKVADAKERNQFEELRVLTDRRSKNSDLKSTRVLILKRSEFLPHKRIGVLLARCVDMGIKLVLLVSSGSSAFTRFRISREGNGAPNWITVIDLSTSPDSAYSNLSSKTTCPDHVTHRR